VKDKDRKTLELLYESIISQNVLLEEEKEFIKQLANNITNNIYKNISPHTRFYGSERLDNIVHSKFTNDINFGSAFTNITQEQRRAIAFVFEQSILVVLYCYLVAIEGQDQPENVCFKTIDDWMNKINNKDVKVPYKNKKKVFEMMENSIISLLFFVYNSYADPNGMYHNETVKVWYEWRKEKLAYKKLVNKLPELRGVF